MLYYSSTHTHQEIMLRREELVNRFVSNLESNKGAHPALILGHPVHETWTDGPVSDSPLILREVTREKWNEGVKCQGHPPDASSITVACFYLLMHQELAKKKANNPDATKHLSDTEPFPIFVSKYPKPDIVTLVREKMTLEQGMTLWRIYTGAPLQPVHLLSDEQMMNILSCKGCSLCRTNSCTGECRYK